MLAQSEPCWFSRGIAIRSLLCSHSLTTTALLKCLLVRPIYFVPVVWKRNPAFTWVAC